MQKETKTTKEAQGAEVVEKKVNTMGILRGLKNAIRNLYQSKLITQDEAKQMINIYERVEKEHTGGGFGI